MRKSKKKTLSVSSEDRLSNLPEGVLCHILSYLGTTNACRTSILSKYWRSLWTMVPDVSFYYTERRPDRQYFAGFDNFVNKVLDSRKPQGIRRFNLDYYSDSKFQPHHFNKWVRGAIDCHAEELDIMVNFFSHLPWHHNIEVPLSCFTSEIITTLKLQGNLFFTPSPAWLPSLKILYLNMYYIYDKLVPSLLSACPVLEEFYICRRYEVMDISAPKLKKLSASFECVLRSTSRFEIDAPSLEYISLKDTYPTKYVIKNLDNVMEAQLSIVVNWRDRGCLSDLFKGLSNVKSLYLSICYRSDKEFERDSTENLPNPHHCLPEFPNLVRLRFDGFSELDLLPSFLQKSPKLEVLVIERHYLADAFWTKPQEVPCCLSSSLTHFTYKGFLAKKEEFESVEYIFRNSSVLKTLTVQPALSLTAKPRKERRGICKELARLPRGSKSCEFRFEKKPFHSGKGVQNQYQFNMLSRKIILPRSAMAKGANQTGYKA